MIPLWWLLIFAGIAASARLSAYFYNTEEGYQGVSCWKSIHSFHLFSTSQTRNIKSWKYRNTKSVKHKTDEDQQARDQWIIWISFWISSAPPKEEIDAAVDALEAAIELIRSGQGAGRQRVGGIGPNMS